MHRKIMLCLLGLLVASAPVAGSAHGAPHAGVFTGTEVSEFYECAQDSLEIAVNGVQLSHNSWAFDTAGINTEATCGDVPAFTIPFLGLWKPAGGCIPSVGTDQTPIGLLHLCLTDPVATPGEMTVYKFSVCETPAPCDDPFNPETIEALVVTVSCLPRLQQCTP